MYKYGYICINMCIYVYAYTCPDIIGMHMQPKLVLDFRPILAYPHFPFAQYVPVRAFLFDLLCQIQQQQVLWRAFFGARTACSSGSWGAGLERRNMGKMNENIWKWGKHDMRILSWKITSNQCGWWFFKGSPWVGKTLYRLARSEKTGLGKLYGSKLGTPI